MRATSTDWEIFFICPLGVISKSDLTLKGRVTLETPEFYTVCTERANKPKLKSRKKKTMLAYCWPCSDPTSWEIRESKHIVTPHLLSRGSRRVGHHDKDGRTPNTQWSVAAVVDDYHCKWTHNFYMHILKFSGTWRLSQSVRRTLYTQSDTNFSCFKQFIKYEGKKHRTPGKRRQQWNAKLSRQSHQNTWEG